jgi:hypothetical protein
MMGPLPRAALILVACTGLIACSQQQPRYAAADPPAAQRAKLCIAEGRPDAMKATDPEHATWSITVSSEGAPCQHLRDLGGLARAFEVVSPPAHGHLTQDAAKGGTVVSYWPEHGYVGSDNFTLRQPGRNDQMRYLVAVLP